MCLSLLMARLRVLEGVLRRVEAVLGQVLALLLVDLVVGPCVLLRDRDLGEAVAFAGASTTSVDDAHKCGEKRGQHRINMDRVIGSSPGDNALGSMPQMHSQHQHPKKQDRLLG